MRIVGLILALIGGLALGFETFGAAVPVRVPPVVSGIVLVFGLLILSTSQSDDEP